MYAESIMSAQCQWEAQKEEIFSLKNIYCGPGECSLLPPHTFDQLEGSDNPPYEADLISLTVNLRIENYDKPIVLAVTYQLPHFYPQESPTVTLLSEDLIREGLSDLEEQAAAFAETLKPEPCLFSVVEWIKDILPEVIASHPSYLKARTPSTQQASTTKLKTQEHEENSTPLLKAHTVSKTLDTSTANNTICIVKLDHMRNEQRYFKTLRTWSRELNIQGKVLSAGTHFIFVVLSGSREDVGEFLHRWKTQHVDVDSRGKPCKEKMMSVLCRQDTPLAAMRRQVLVGILSIIIALKIE